MSFLNGKTAQKYDRVCSLKKIVLVMLFLQAVNSFALPVGFYVNQGDREYSEIKSEGFYLYHDSRVPREAKAMINSLEAARPTLENWFKDKRSRPLPVIMSAISDNASFANLITDAVEIQTRGYGDRDLAWHEYVHSTMYQRLDNFLGPPGTVLHVLWMPAWFLEGLAEALSVSLQSDVTAGIERYQALSGQWPSYEKLHSLYNTGSFARIGYATSGRFVAYILRQIDADKLPEFLDHFYWNTMPWWYIWTMVPWNGFLPLDDTLETYLGKNGKELYEDYKRFAKDYWEAHTSGVFLAGEKKEKRLGFTSFNNMFTYEGKAFLSVVEDGSTYLAQLKFDKKTGWLTGQKYISKIGEADDHVSIVGYGRYGHYFNKTKSKEKKINLKIVNNEDLTNEYTYSIKYKDSKLERRGRVEKFWRNSNGLREQSLWLENHLGTSRLCFVDGGDFQKFDCTQEFSYPDSLEFLGEDNQQGKPFLWFRHSQDTLTGTRHRLVGWDWQTRSLDSISLNENLKPLSVASLGSAVYMIVSGKDKRVLRRFQRQQSGLAPSSCQESEFDDHLIGMIASDNRLLISVYGGQYQYLKRVSPADLNWKACQQLGEHVSPILIAMSESTAQVSLADAMKKSDPWSDSTGYRSSQKEQALDAVEVQSVEKNSQPAEWRGRTVMPAIPWIGNDDALGMQLGIISVPLMDHMQNETVRMTVLYGLASNFPYQDITLTSTRFKPTWNFSLYRQQTWNGQFYKRSTGELISAYFDEKGAKVSVEDKFRALGGVLGVEAGVKYAALKPYLGPKYPVVQKGNLVEPNLSVLHSKSFGPLHLSNSVNARVAPGAMNKQFDYNQVGFSTTTSFSMPFRGSMNLGLEGSRTRGPKTFALREVYRPLKTFVPGSGGGYNKNSFPINDTDGGLFSPVYGDTQARGKINYTFPIVPDFERMFWILYVDRLDFTAFWNYGGAWSGEKPSQGWDKLIRAHGYSLDLQLDNKGVRFNTGLGSGQVLGKQFQVYWTFGFDAIF